MDGKTAAGSATARSSAGASGASAGAAAGAAARAWANAVGRWLWRHALFAVVLAGAIALRALAIAGHPSVLWTGDSIVYLNGSLTLAPSPNRPSGYSLLLWALRPFHSFTAVLAVQAALGVLTGVMVYALVWRTARTRWPRPSAQSPSEGRSVEGEGGARGRALWWLPACLAVVAAVPVLFDGNQLLLEHLLLSDELFGFLVMAAVAVLLWRPARSLSRGRLLGRVGVAGALLGCAAVTRMAGVPLIAVVLIAMAVYGRPGRRLLTRTAQRTDGRVAAEAGGDVGGGTGCAGQGVDGCAGARAERSAEGVGESGGRVGRGAEEVGDSNGGAGRRVGRGEERFGESDGHRGAEGLGMSGGRWGAGGGAGGWGVSRVGRWVGALGGAAVLVGAFVVPVVAYMGWFRANHGEFGMSKHGAVWLYGRTASFADCARVTERHPDLAVLCPRRPPSDPRVTSPVYAAMYTPDSPFRRLPGGIYGPHSNAPAERFAWTAITAQPLDYARVVIKDTLKTFAMGRSPYPTTWTEAQLHFPAVANRAFDKPPAARQKRLALVYGGDSARPRIVNPYARWVRQYQADWYVPGPALAVLLGIGLVGVAVRLLRRGERRSRTEGAAILLPWLTAAALLVIPVATADFDYRYVLPALPLACLAAALAVIPGRKPGPAASAPQSPVVRAKRAPQRADGIAATQRADDIADPDPLV